MANLGEKVSQDLLSLAPIYVSGAHWVYIPTLEGTHSYLRNPHNSVDALLIGFSFTNTKEAIPWYERLINPLRSPKYKPVLAYVANQPALQGISTALQVDALVQGHSSKTDARLLGLLRDSLVNPEKFRENPVIELSEWTPSRFDSKVYDTYLKGRARGIVPH